MLLGILDSHYYNKEVITIFHKNQLQIDSFTSCQPVDCDPFGKVKRHFHWGHLRSYKNTDIYKLIFNSSKFTIIKLH